MTTIDYDYARPATIDAVTSGRLSSPVKRLFASLIDSFLSVAIVTAIYYCYAGSFTAMLALQKPFSPLQNLADTLIGLALFLILHGYLLATQGQTIGKWVYGIRVVRTDRSKVGLRRILMLREMPLFVITAIPLPYVSAALMLLDAIFIFRSSRQCLHDQLADTVVINV